jgi:uncharacterized protein YndB with AHSA1/START domain
VPSFTSTIAVRRSPEQVFAVLDDLEQAPRWMPAIKRIDVLTPGMRMGVGFKWRETRRVLGILRMKVVLVVTAHEAPRTWGLTFNDGKVQATATFELEPTPGGTKVTFVEDVEDLQGKPKRAERMLRMMEKQDGDLLDRLKAHVESTTEAPAGLAEEPDVRASAPEASAPEAAAKPMRKTARPRAGKAAKKAAPKPGAPKKAKGSKR